MSQYSRSNPIFNFSTVDGTVYEQQPYPFNEIYDAQQWWSPGMAAVMPSAPSPTHTVRTHRSAPSRHVPQRQRRVEIVEQNSNLDPRLQHAQQRLPRLNTQQPAAGQHNAEPILNPITLFYNQNEEPWNQFGMRNVQDSTAQNNFLQTQVYHGQHHRGPCSDAGSNVPVSDSGYYTHQTPSVLSNEPGNTHQELPAGLLDRTRHLNVDRSPTGSQPMTRRPSDQRSVLSHHSSRSGRNKQVFPCREPGCSEVSKSASEQKKHMLKHVKHFVCTEPDCKRAGKGFSTTNDLDRHKKSVHKICIANSKSYLCAASSCTNKGKIWPRMDNFKQHVERMHKDEDHLDLIRRSEYRPSDSPYEQLPLSIDPVLLAGMGDSHDNLASSSTHNFPYQASVSLNTTSMTNGSAVSPSTISLDLPFSQFGATPSANDSASLSGNNNLALSVANPSNVPVGRRKSSKASSTNMPSVPPAPGVGSVSQLQLSTAPQTKSEQQKQALAKLSKANINIEDIVQRVLGAQQQQDGGARGAFVLSDIESFHASQAIADLVKQKSKTTQLQQLRLMQGSAAGDKQCTVEGCGFIGRTCDLNKHKKRHEKPYGCTYPKCSKVFGAKSDWKRHENSQHFQLEAFRCDVLNMAGKKCGQHCYRPTQFQKHLEEKHKIPADFKFEASLKRCRIGKNCQGQFWCGFCEKIVVLKNKRNAAWDERFDHIAHHVEKEQKRIDTWLCVEENKTKKQLHADMDRNDFADEDEGEKDADDDANDAGQAATQLTWSSVKACQPSGHESLKRRRMATNSPMAQPHTEKPKPTILWNCCVCHDGPVTYSVQLSCPACSHAFCDRCDRFYADDNES